MSRGTLYGVSVGPGDPELMTIKAAKTIEACPVIAAPRTKGENTLALDIAKGAASVEGKEIIYLDFNMKADHEARMAAHRQIAEQVIEKLDEGKDVALLNLGDATLYGTWSYIEKRIMDAGYACETVSGVTSFCASAAKLHKSLTKMNLPLHILPGNSGVDIEGELELSGTKVLMKSGSALPDIKKKLEDLGMADKASMVVNCGLPDERVLDHLEVLGDEGYFVIVLVED